MLITPKTKIHELLTGFPELEDEQVALAPEFRKLQNPVLRKTVARVTTLSQAAAIGGLKVEELVNTLRRAASQSGIPSTDEGGSDYNIKKPRWFRKKRISSTIDIRVILEEGNQPVHEVLTAVKSLKNNEILEVIAPFLPAPLIDKAGGLGFSHWVWQLSADEYRVYFIYAHP